jgi:RimJ/RimL family protein N-acetyltransferase
LFLAIEKERPLHAHVAKHNPASRRVLEKCGFTVVREGRGTAHGVTCDEVVLRLD